MTTTNCVSGERTPSPSTWRSCAGSSTTCPRGLSSAVARSLSGTTSLTTCPDSPTGSQCSSGARGRQSSDRADRQELG